MPKSQFAFFDFLRSCGTCVDESCESSTKTTDCVDGSSTSGSTNRAFTHIWHKLHVILWFGTCAGGAHIWHNRLNFVTDCYSNLLPNGVI